MATQEEIETELAAIEAKLSSGVESVTTDGTSTRVNLQALERRADDLRRRLDSFKMTRPVASKISLGGFLG